VRCCILEVCRCCTCCSLSMACTLRLDWIGCCISGKACSFSTCQLHPPLHWRCWLSHIRPSPHTGVPAPQQHVCSRVSKAA
jgi:hypothetical protein